MGTFGDRDFYHPIKRPFDVLPKSPEELDIRFMLFTRKNNVEFQKLKYNASSVDLLQTNYNGTARTKIVVHGFGDVPTKGTWMLRIVKFFLINEDLNVFVLDWSVANLANNYIQVSGVCGLYCLCSMDFWCSHVLMHV